MCTFVPSRNCVHLIRHIRIAGRHNGYVQEYEMDPLVEEIHESNADILFPALGEVRVRNAG